MSSQFVSSDTLRTWFAATLSDMYRIEVPPYGALLDLVQRVNASELATDQSNGETSEGFNQMHRLSVERHGAIRLASYDELRLLSRAFALLGMKSVGYYDLTVANIPFHSTAFRPITAEALAANPFRLFTSVLRTDLFQDNPLSAEIAAVCTQRTICTTQAVSLIEQGEQAGGLTAEQGELFVAELAKTFAWRGEGCVSFELYKKFQELNPLLADVVSFPNPHLNHLTPRTLAIEVVQDQMLGVGITPKAIIEGPPMRQCPILLRQTSFKALAEPALFETIEAQHTARFGEIEQRGVALTPKGRALYDQLLQKVRSQVLPTEENASRYKALLHESFQAFPDTWHELHTQKLAYFTYSWADTVPAADRNIFSKNYLLDELLAQNLVTLSPIIYEDFLPVSAAGIFQSNAKVSAEALTAEGSSQKEFEAGLGHTPFDPFVLYAQLQEDSLEALRS